jgi:hypothetical protein
MIFFCNLALRAADGRFSAPVQRTLQFGRPESKKRQRVVDGMVFPDGI